MKGIKPRLTEITKKVHNKPPSSRQYHQMDTAQPPALCHDHRAFQVLSHSQNFKGHSVGGSSLRSLPVLSLMTLFSAAHLHHRDLGSITQQYLLLLPTRRDSDSVHTFCSRISLPLFLQAVSTSTLSSNTALQNYGRAVPACVYPLK